MSLRFNADEIFEIAEKIEKNGAAFYRKAAKQFKEAEASDLMEGFAAMEEEHRIIFSALRSEVSENESETTIFDPDNQIKDYLGAIADGNVFDISTDPTTLLTGKESLEEILRMSIGFEKDSIIFYLGMRDMVPERLGRTKIDNIIEEEKSHIVLLSKKLDEIKKS